MGGYSNERGDFMINGRNVLFPFLALVSAAGIPACGQSVVSTHSGVIYFFEGSVFNGGERLEQKFGRFPDIAEGGELRTERGRAEVLLTPGVFLRVDENSSIRMLSTQLSDTRVELLGGSAIVESDGSGPDRNSVRLIYKNWQVRIPHDGVYRIDADPPQVLVYRGDIEVAPDGKTEAVAVRRGEVLPLAAVLVAEQASAHEDDAFKTWAMSRSQAISADTSIAAQIFDDPRQSDPTGLDLGGFSYFPMTGIPALGITSPYGLSFWSPYQSTLAPLYSPGSLYGPRYLGWPRTAPIYSRPIGVSPTRIGTGLHPGGIGTPRFPVMPGAIGPPRGTPHAGFHGGGHR
jgi:hypothetical protein